jgi:hypothetical protein
MSEHDRIRATARLIHDRGLNQDVAEVIALALFPFDTAEAGKPVSRRFPKKIAKRTKRFRKTAKLATREALVDLARDTLQDYCDLAVRHGEAYYIAKFEEATAGPAHWVSDAAEGDSDSAPNSMAGGDVPQEMRERIEPH